MTDPIADFLTRIRNAIKARHRVLEIPASKLKADVARILFEQGYILNYKTESDKGPQGTLKIALKYDSQSGLPAITGLKRVSRPGLRQYRGADNMPRVKNGLGVAIVSTSNGVITDKQARNLNVGGEVLCFIH